MAEMSVSACLVTRGDVDMRPVIESIPNEWELVIWNNSARCEICPPQADGRRVVRKSFAVDDLAVYGRYAAIEYASGDLCYVQDDDVIVSDPQAIVDTWIKATETDEIDDSTWWPDTLVVCNMPEAHRSQPFYKEHALVGFGAVFRRDAPGRAFARFEHQRLVNAGGLCRTIDEVDDDTRFFRRRCDVLFTALTPRVLVDVPIRNLPYYDAPNRSWKQPNHFKERKKMLELALAVRDA